MQLDHPQRNIQIDQIKVAFSMNTMAAEGLVVELEVGKLWSVAGVFVASPPSLYSLMRLDHPHSNIRIDQIEVDLSMNMLAAEGLVVK